MSDFDPMQHPVTESALRAGVPEILIRAAQDPVHLVEIVLGHYRDTAIRKFESARRRAIARQIRQRQADQERQT